MADKKAMELAERLCAKIMDMTEQGYLRGPDLLRITEMCLEVCRREEAEAEEMLKPVSSVLH